MVLFVPGGAGNSSPLQEANRSNRKVEIIAGIILLIGFASLLNRLHKESYAKNILYCY
jgi:hypothetical protein